MVDLSRIHKFGPVMGSGNIAVPLRFESRWIPIAIRVHFNGGTGTATLTADVDDTTYTALEWRLTSIAAAGTGTDVNWRLSEQEVHAWSFEASQRLVLNWTNPDPINMTWGLECHYLNA